MGLFNNFTKEQLQRKNLVNIIENWDNRKEINIDKEAYLTYLNKLEEEINKHSYKKDNRFITYGRRDFLRREFTERLNYAVQSNDTNKYINALVDLEEYIYTQNYISITSIPNNETKDFRKLDKINTEYYNSGIICKEEKDIIIGMIQEFKQQLKETDNEKLYLHNETEDYFKKNGFVKIKKDNKIIIKIYNNGNTIKSYVYKFETNIINTIPEKNIKFAIALEKDNNENFDFFINIFNPSIQNCASPTRTYFPGLTDAYNFFRYRFNYKQQSILKIGLDENSYLEISVI